MNCAKCEGEMNAVEINGVELYICGSCEGIWFDYEKLCKIIQIPEEKLKNSQIAQSLEKNHEDVREFYAICPKCKKPMEVQVYCYDSGVEIDRCAVCGGIWLDDGEIRAIIDYCKKNKGPLPPEKVLDMKIKLAEVKRNCRDMDDNIYTGADAAAEVVGDIIFAILEGILDSF